MRKITRIIFVGLLTASTAVAAQHKNDKPESYRYSWKDDSGQPHFSDSLTNDAIKNGYDVINSNGLVVRHVDRQMTPEERKIADAAQAKANEAKAAKARQEAEDEQMLAAYPNVRVYRDAQEAEIDELTQTVHTTEVNLHAQEQNLADLLAHVADMKHDNQPIPKYLQQRIDQQRASVTEQRATLAQQKAARSKAQKDVEARIKHYRELRAKDRNGE